MGKTKEIKIKLEITDSENKIQVNHTTLKQWKNTLWDCREILRHYCIFDQRACYANGKTCPLLRENNNEFVLRNKNEPLIRLCPLNDLLAICKEISKLIGEEL